MATGRNCQGENSLLSDADRSRKPIEEQRATGRSTAEPKGGLPCREGLNLFVHKTIGITSPAMRMNSRGQLEINRGQSQNCQRDLLFSFNMSVLGCMLMNRTAFL